MGEKVTIVGATEEIIKMAKENNGTVTTAMVVVSHVEISSILLIKV